jgi:hypothetical protein
MGRRARTTDPGTGDRGTAGEERLAADGDRDMLHVVIPTGLGAARDADT